jgi:hypothetical protein
VSAFAGHFVSVFSGCFATAPEFLEEAAETAAAAAKTETAFESAAKPKAAFESAAASETIPESAAAAEPA